MRDLIVQWLTEASAPFWQSSLSIDQFVTALQETFQMVFFSLLLAVFGIDSRVTLVVTRTGGILQNRVIYYFLNPIVNALRSLPLYHFINCRYSPD